MQTQYQLLYRYVNETTNTAITDEYDYTETKEFYTPEHKLYFTTAQLKNFGWDSKNQKNKMDLQFWFDNKSDPDASTGGIYTGTAGVDYVASITGEGETEREAIILNEMANANKSNNFYIYDGTTKEYHKTFVPEAIGYKVANVAGVPARQMPTGPNDYSKHFVMLGGSKPGIDGAFLVCKSEYISAYKTAYSELNSKKEQIVLSGEKFANNLIFDWYNPQDDSYIPAYGETSAALDPVTRQTINTLLSPNGYRIVNLDGDDYLITEAVEYWSNVKFSQTGQATDYNGRVTTRYYNCAFDGTVHESMLTTAGSGGKRVTFGTLFFNCGTVIPKEITFASEDGTTLADASTILPSAQSSTVGDDVYDAFAQYTASLNNRSAGTATTGAGGYTETDNRNQCMSQSSHPHLLWYKGWKISDLEAANMGNFISTLTVAKSNITRYPIPAHYEPSGKAPYLIKDNYKKIPLSPWILHSVHNSLESGLEKARTLVSMIGIDNVKLVKTVPFDQFVKIK
jgi:hypothetical protein